MVVVASCGRSGCGRAPADEGREPRDDLRTAASLFRAELARATDAASREHLARAIVERSDREDAAFERYGDAYRHYEMPQPQYTCLAAGTCFRDYMAFQKRAFETDLPLPATSPQFEQRVARLASQLDLASISRELDQRIELVADALPRLGDTVFRGPENAKTTVYVIATGHPTEKRREATITRILRELSATGATSAWLAQHVTADRRAILSLPKGDFVGAVTVPNELGPLSLSIGEVALDAVGFDPTARGEASRLLAALGRTLGGDLGVATVSEGGGRRELVARIHVEDAAAAKAAASALVKTFAKTARGTMKVEIVPYTKFGAIGERLDTREKAAPDKDSWYWALRDSTLYVGACLACFTEVFDAALDPARTGTLEHAAALKPKLDAVPDAGIFAATVMKNGATVDVTTLAASAAGVTLQGSIPLGWLFAGVEQLGLFEGDEGGEDPDTIPPP